MDTQDKVYTAYVKLETQVKHIVKAENFDHAIQKLKHEYPNGEITHISLEANVTLI